MFVCSATRVEHHAAHVACWRTWRKRGGVERDLSAATAGDSTAHRGRHVPPLRRLRSRHAQFAGLLLQRIPLRCAVSSSCLLIHKPSLRTSVMRGELLSSESWRYRSLFVRCVRVEMQFLYDVNCYPTSKFKKQVCMCKTA